ncbi:MAG: AMP-binding protein [Methylophilaceae bacterium]
MNSQLIPLVTHDSPDSVIAWRDDGAVSLRQFLADVKLLTTLLPSSQHILNTCSNRYHFSVGLAAAIVTGKVSLLPSANTPEMVYQLKAFAPEVFCLTDNDACLLDIPRLRYPTMPPVVNNSDNLSIPQISSSQLIAIVFTSGSTGTPLPHPKAWGALVHCVQAEVLSLGLLNNSSACTLVGTVPPQHMYGFESTVLLAWQSGNALSHAHPFYPADICQALALVPSPRVLVSSPVHLRALLESELAIPKLTCVVSATAPLSAQLALDIEARCGAPLIEVYGSTETGQIATRRPSQTSEWQLFPEIKLVKKNERIYATGGHIPSPTPMSDSIEFLSDNRFLLHGRLADMVNIAGKRHSLTSLNHLLNAIPGVIDGAFYMPHEGDSARITRLAACVVAPELNPTKLLAALREYIDPIFLPRPLLFLDALPRNSTGKLPHAALVALFNQARSHGNTYETNQIPELKLTHKTRKSA